jgi:hypothetical protein
MDFIPGKTYNRLEYLGQRFDLPQPQLGPSAAVARAHAANPSSFINFSIDAPTVHLFKVIDCFMNFQYDTNQFVHHNINVVLYI